MAGGATTVVAIAAPEAIGAAGVVGAARPPASGLFDGEGGCVAGIGGVSGDGTVGVSMRRGYRGAGCRVTRRSKAGRAKCPRRRAAALSPLWVNRAEATQ